MHIRQAGKPGSVLDSHSSRHAVADMLKQPTRMLGEPRQRILFGLAPNGVWPATRCCQRHGALLPHHFTLTCAALPQPSAVMLSVPLSVASRRPAVSRHPALCSPDFPPRVGTRGDCLPDCGAAAIIAEVAGNVAVICAA